MLSKGPTEGVECRLPEENLVEASHTGISCNNNNTSMTAISHKLRDTTATKSSPILVSNNNYRTLEAETVGFMGS